VVDVPTYYQNEIEIAVFPGWPECAETAWKYFPNLKWIHNTFVGCDMMLKNPAFAKRDFLLSNAKDSSKTALAEFTISSCLYFYKKLGLFEKSKEKSEWKTEVPITLDGKKILVVGYGNIGSKIGKMCKNGFDMEVYAIKRTLSEKDKDLYPEVKEFYTCEDLGRACNIVDIVVNVLPYTPATKEIFTEDIFRAMQRHAIFINVGRGENVKDSALIKALKENWIANAALDVFNNEPLQSSSPFYTDEDVRSKILMSCHAADKVEECKIKRREAFFKNFEMYRKCGKLYSLVDKIAGY